MRIKLLMLLLALGLSSMTARAQWVVTDPGNLTQGIMNSINEMVHTSSTATNMLNSFKETVKIYTQAKEYYDKLRAVNNLIKDAKKVQQSLLMLNDITSVYVNNYGKMLNDPYYSVKELSSIAFGYAEIMQMGVDAIAELKDVVNVTSLSMNDKERMDIVDRVHKSMQKYRSLANYYTKKNIAAGIARGKEKQDTERILELYGGDERYW